jgi:hypothetical protein
MPPSDDTVDDTVRRHDPATRSGSTVGVIAGRALP